MASILKKGRNFWCDHPVAGAGLLVDGDDYYRAFYEAGQKAKRYILLAGWQFDSNACLLRGQEAKQALMPVELLKYLNALCEKNQALRIYVLAWDFHAVFSLEREWMQALRFNWMTSDRLQFRFDSSHAEGGSHHQKFVVLDGELSFLGGLDLCDHRWDDRQHRVPNPLRVSRGEPHQPFHDVQAYLVGREIGAELTGLFSYRWEASGGEPLELPTESIEPLDLSEYAPQGAVALAPVRAVLSRTDPQGCPTNQPNCRELCNLHLDAIRAARRVLYVETQYFSSREIGAALVERLRSDDNSTLEVVLVLNMQAETLKEQIAVGLAQAKIIMELREAAQGTRHHLGIYYTVPEAEGGAEPERATYIHSKLMVVDDRFLSVGSANLTNRSTCIDTELNMSVESDDVGDVLGQSIARARRSLIAEHLGVPEFDEIDGIVSHLDDLARRREGRLRLHPSPTDQERAILEVIDPQQLPFDPDAMEAQDQDRSIFIGGMAALWNRLSSGDSSAPGAA